MSFSGRSWVALRLFFSAGFIEPGEVLLRLLYGSSSGASLGLSPSLHQEKLSKLHQRAMFLLLCSAPSCQRFNAADRPFSSLFRAVPLLRSFGWWLQFCLIRFFPVKGKSIRLSICFPKPSKIFVECPYCPFGCVLVSSGFSFQSFET